MIETIIGVVAGALIFFAGLWFGWNMGRNGVVMDSKATTTLTEEESRG